MTAITTTAKVTARFLKADDIIERGGHLFRVLGKAIVDPQAVNRVQIVVNDLEADTCEMQAVTLHKDLWVDLYDIEAA